MHAHTRGKNNDDMDTGEEKLPVLATLAYELNKRSFFESHKFLELVELAMVLLDSQKWDRRCSACQLS